MMRNLSTVPEKLGPSQFNPETDLEKTLLEGKYPCKQEAGAPLGATCSLVQEVCRPTVAMEGQEM